MLNFIFGAAAMACLYTFWPALAVVPSGWLKSAWAWIKEQIGTRKDAP